MLATETLLVGRGTHLVLLGLVEQESARVLCDIVDEGFSLVSFQGFPAQEQMAGVAAQLCAVLE